MHALEALPYVATENDLGLSDYEYLATFPDIDPRQVGTLVGSGRDFDTFAYGLDEVLKVPNVGMFLDTSTAVVQQERVALMQEYFGDYLAPTTVVASPDHPYFVARQRRIMNPRSLTASSMRDLQVPLRDIVVRNRRLQAEHGVCVDYLGKDGTSSALRALVDPRAEAMLTNILIEDTQEGPELRLVDIGLLEFGSSKVY